MSDDRPTEFWQFEDDPEETGRLQGPAPRGPAPDEELTRVGAAPAPTGAPGPAPTAHVGGGGRDWLEAAPAGAHPPSGRRARRVRRKRPPVLPRIIAPVVFLAAVIAVFTLTVDSGVLDDTGPGAKKTPSAQASKAPKKHYVVKKGDTLSEIAAKYDTTEEELRRLNPRLSVTTLTPGEKIKLPSRD